MSLTLSPICSNRLKLAKNICDFLNVVDCSLPFELDKGISIKSVKLASSDNPLTFFIEIGSLKFS